MISKRKAKQINAIAGIVVFLVLVIIIGKGAFERVSLANNYRIGIVTTEGEGTGARGVWVNFSYYVNSKKFMGVNVL